MADRPAIEQDRLYEQAAAEFGAPLARLARGYEADRDKRRDLLQEIHLALWRSLRLFDGRCSLRTWVFRVAHNVATTQVIRRRAHAPALVSLDELDATAAVPVSEPIDRRLDLERLLALVRTLKPIDRRVILLYLEGLDAASIGEITGLSPGNVAVKIHRIKDVLSQRFWQRTNHEA